MLFATEPAGSLKRARSLGVQQKKFAYFLSNNNILMNLRLEEQILIKDIFAVSVSKADSSLLYLP